MQINEILEWVSYTLLVILMAYVLGYECWIYYKETLNIDLHHLPGQVLLSTSSFGSSQENVYFSIPRGSFHIPPEVNDGLSEFEYSIMVDQPMVLTNANPFCHQKAQAGLKPEHTTENILTSCSFSRNNEIKYVIQENDAHSVDGLVESLDKVMLRLDVSDSDEDNSMMFTGNLENQNNTSKIWNKSIFFIKHFDVSSIKNKMSPAM